jgi:hypothetical protein
VFFENVLRLFGKFGFVYWLHLKGGRVGEREGKGKEREGKGK